ncbi:MAG: hypothetical protein ACRCSN_04820 [Dermatophilaceae bacterium]
MAEAVSYHWPVAAETHGQGAVLALAMAVADWLTGDLDPTSPLCVDLTAGSYDPAEAPAVVSLLCDCLGDLDPFGSL